jgi:hypothetical protein
MFDFRLKKIKKKIEEELNYAETKHPDFCTKFLDPAIDWEEKERLYKIMNSHSPFYADAILLEEVAEAMNAYKQGNKKHCLQELSQCGAVIFRMMEQVESEIIQERNKNAEKILNELQKE